MAFNLDEAIVLVQSLCFFNIDRIALVKQEDNVLGSNCPSVYQFVCLSSPVWTILPSGFEQRMATTSINIVSVSVSVIGDNNTDAVNRLLISFVYKCNTSE